jgi:hypothetical protein
MGRVVKDTMTCPECIEFFAAVCPGRTVLSRADVDYHHWTHRPMHPSQTGANHRAAAKKAWAAWEAHS